MSPRFQSLLVNLGALILIAGGFLFLVHQEPTDVPTSVVEHIATSTSAEVGPMNTGSEAPLPTVPVAKATSTREQATSTLKSASKSPAQKPVVKKQISDEATRIENPYPFPPESFAAVNDAARAALVNILCMPQGGMMQPISGSGVIIDPRGVILTNAHVAQYVLLSRSPQINLSCTIRAGAPALARWSGDVLYIPPVWVEAHAREVSMARPMGTGEHDYALLLIARSLDGSPLPIFPSLPVDTREAIGFQGDQVLVASYPAEFVGAFAAQFNLYPATSITTIGQLLTFVAKTVDLFSLGGIVEAQSGSSGGAVVNAWGHLVGLISTTSEGDTTATRDLRAITLSYINRDLAVQTQFDISTILGGDIFAEALDFNTNVAPHLIELYIEQLSQ